jgi:long-subunit fatty acid transport protein
LLFGTAAGLIVTAAGTAPAAGFCLKGQSVKGLGRANSGEVADPWRTTGPHALVEPPAIGGQNEREARFGASAIVPGARSPRRAP